MLHEVSTQLSKVLEQKRLREKLTRDVESVATELREKSDQLETLTAHLKKEQVDVDRLEQNSLTSLFYSVLGSRDEQLDKERQELLAAQLKHGQMKHQVDYLQRELDRLQEQAHALDGVEAEYESLLSQKEDLLRRTHQTVAAQLLDLSVQIANHSAQEAEITEAIAAGNAVMARLDLVIDSLRSAEGWGAWDIFGGGFLATAAKHSRIDEARVHIHEVQTGMSHFKRELADVQKNIDLKVDIGEFDYFADFFFDGLIMDWIVQSKITDSLTRAKAAKDVIGQAVGELEVLRKTTQTQLNDVKQNRTLLIEQT